MAGRGTDRFVMFEPFLFLLPGGVRSKKVFRGEGWSDQLGERVNLEKGDNREKTIPDPIFFLLVNMTPLWVG